MSAIETNTEIVLAEFQKITGAEPLIPLFQDITDQNTLRAVSISNRITTPDEKGWKDINIDILIADAKDKFPAGAAIRHLGSGLALFLVTGSSQDLLKHHPDLLKNPPIYGDRKDLSISGIKDACWDCNLKLWTVISAGWDSHPLRINLFTSEMNAGSTKTSWLLDILQRVNSSNQVSPFIRK